jgi:hypothetical protein
MTHFNYKYIIFIFIIILIFIILLIYNNKKQINNKSNQIKQFDVNPNLPNPVFLLTDNNGNLTTFNPSNDVLNSKWNISGDIYSSNINNTGNLSTGSITSTGNINCNGKLITGNINSTGNIESKDIIFEGNLQTINGNVNVKNIDCYSLNIRNGTNGQGQLKIGNTIMTENDLKILGKLITKHLLQEIFN